MFAPAPAERLATLRILVGGCATTYACVRLPAFVELLDAEPSALRPVGVLSWLRSPLPDPLWATLIGATIALGVAFTLGVAFRATGPLFAVSLLTLTTYRSSWGQVLHFEDLLVLHVLIVGFSRAADALARPLRHRSRSTSAGPSIAYGWPVRLAATVTAATYVLAGVAKLRYGGLGWMSGESLRNHIAYSAARLQLLGGHPSPLAGPAVRHAWLLGPAAVVTVVIELGAPVALLGRRWRTLWVAGTWLLHAGILATMFVVFFYPLSLIAFAPLFDLEHVGAWWRRRRARQTKPATA